MTEQEGLITDWDMDMANEAGQNSMEWAENATGLSDANAVMVYGIVAFSLATITMILFILLDHTNTMKGLRWGIYLHWGIWVPLSMVWVGVSFFDSEMMREIFKWIVELSVLGPFGGYWIAFVKLMDHATETKDWDNWKLWITIPVWLVYTVFSMLFQVHLVPKVLRWIESGESVRDDIIGNDIDISLDNDLLAANISF